jgi:hypothetical protein
MGGAKTVDASKYISKPDPKSMYDITMAQSLGQQRGLQQQADLLSYYTQMPPEMQRFDAAKTSKQAAEFGMANLERSKEFERLTDPATAKMRAELGSKVAEITNLDAARKWGEQLGLKSGLMRGMQSGLGSDSLIGRSAIYDAATEAGRQARLQNLQLQQGYLARTQAPVGGLDPAALISAEQAAKAQNMAALQQWQQGAFSGAGRIGQSTTDWINSNLGQLSAINQTGRQDQRNYEQAMYNAAALKAQQENAMKQAYISAAGQIVGAVGGAMIGGPMGAAAGSKLGSMFGGGKSAYPGVSSYQDLNLSGV